MDEIEHWTQKLPCTSSKTSLW